MDFTGWRHTTSFEFIAPPMKGGSPWQICEQVLNAIKTQAERLIFRGFYFGKYFPLPVLDMQNEKLNYLDVSDSYLNCSCALARETENFMKDDSISVYGQCYDGSKHTFIRLRKWVKHNYKRCQNTQEKLQHFTTDGCNKTFCDFPTAKPLWSYIWPYVVGVVLAIVLFCAVSCVQSPVDSFDRYTVQLLISWLFIS